MVTDGATAGQEPPLSARTPLLATSAIPVGNLFHIPSWRPRSGRDNNYEPFLEALTGLFHALGLTFEQLYESPPTIAEITPTAGIKLRSGATITATAQQAADADRLAKWLAVNTAIFWHVRPALLIDGAEYRKDARKIATFLNKQLANGRGLVLWALKWTDASSRSAQLTLQTKMLSYSLPVDATRVKLSTHMQDLFELWRLVQGNDPNSSTSMMDYWEALLHVMPTAPEGKHVVNVRTWLAGKVTALKAGSGEASAFEDFDTGSEAILEHAMVLGLPKGTAAGGVGTNVLSFLNTSDGEDEADQVILPLQETKAAGSRNTERKKPGEDGAPTNDCKYCDSFVCTQAVRKGFGSKNCVCRHDSTFDVSAVSQGKRAYIMARRAYDQANPSATTLKGLKLTVRKAKPGEATAQAQPAGSMTAIVAGDGSKGGMTPSQFDSWLTELTAGDSELHVLGDLTDASSVVIEAAESEAAEPETTGNGESEQLQMLKDQLQEQASLITALQSQVKAATAQERSATFTTPPTALPPEWRASSVAVNRTVTSPELTPASEQLSRAMGVTHQGASEQLNLLLNGTTTAPRSGSRKADKERDSSTELMAKAMVAREKERRQQNEDKYGIVPAAMNQLSRLSADGRDWLLARLTPTQRMVVGLALYNGWPVIKAALSAVFAKLHSSLGGHIKDVLSLIIDVTIKYATKVAAGARPMAASVMRQAGDRIAQASHALASQSSSASALTPPSANPLPVRDAKVPASLPSLVTEARAETLDKPHKGEHAQFQEVIDQSGNGDTLNMLVAGSKRSATDVAFVSPEHALALLQAGATALRGVPLHALAQRLQDVDGALARSMRALAPALGITRVYQKSLPPIAVALAHHLGVARGALDHSIESSASVAGVAAASCKNRHSAITKLLDRVCELTGSTPQLELACMNGIATAQGQSAGLTTHAELETAHAMLDMTGSVTAVIGTTGSADRPVSLRLFASGPSLALLDVASETDAAELAELLNAEDEAWLDALDVPANQGEYERSPQYDVWRAAHQSAMAAHRSVLMADHRDHQRLAAHHDYGSDYSSGEELEAFYKANEPELDAFMAQEQTQGWRDWSPPELGDDMVMMIRSSDEAFCHGVRKRGTAPGLASAIEQVQHEVEVDNAVVQSVIQASKEAAAKQVKLPPPCDWAKGTDLVDVVDVRLTIPASIGVRHRAAYYLYCSYNGCSIHDLHEFIAEQLAITEDFILVMHDTVLDNLDELLCGADARINAEHPRQEPMMHLKLMSKQAMIERSAEIKRQDAAYDALSPEQKAWLKICGEASSRFRDAWERRLKEIFNLWRARAWCRVLSSRHLRRRNALSMHRAFSMWQADAAISIQPSPPPSPPQTDATELALTLTALLETHNKAWVDAMESGNAASAAAALAAADDAAQTAADEAAVESSLAALMADSHGRECQLMPIGLDGVVAPIALEAQEKVYFPALCDDGASLKVSCSRTLDGAVLSTFEAADAGGLKVGESTARLTSMGSYVYVYERNGADGTSEVVARRMKHTPSLPFHMVISEPTEVYGHEYAFTFTKDKGRVMTTPEQRVVPLYMNAQGLGWLRVRPITDPVQQAAALGNAETRDASADSLMGIGGGELRSVGMSKYHTKLRGVDLLRREHVRLGHPALGKLVRTLQAEGTFGTLITKADVEVFYREGCGACETSKMQRRPFTLNTTAPRSAITRDQPVGKYWTGDCLELRVPSAGEGYLYIYLAVDSTSNLRFAIGMHGQSADDVIRAREQLRAFVRPLHGEIWIAKHDSHPTHRSRNVGSYMADQSNLDLLSPGHVHEGVGAPEVAFMHLVPAANALLMGASDLGEAHFYSAFMTAMVASNHALKAGSNTHSPMMLWLGTDSWVQSPLYVYGSAVKSLVHPEARDGKFEPHSEPAVYTGPAIHSLSPVHCSIWRTRADGVGEYVDVDVGCINVIEDHVLLRSRRDHPSHQPFNQRGTKHVPSATSEVKQVAGGADASEQSDSVVTANTTQQAETAKVEMGAALGDDQAASEPLPVERSPYVWVSSDEPPTMPFSIGLCSGPYRAGDTGTWLSMLSAGGHQHIRIDERVGGYEHRINRPEVRSALLELAKLEHCVGVFLQLPCGAWSVVKFSDEPGPQPIFTCDSPNGKSDEHGAPLPSVLLARDMVDAAIAIARPVLERGGWFLSEHPAAQGKGSVLSTKGLEQHSGMHQTKAFEDLTVEFGLRTVITDLCGSGHANRKSTEFLCNAPAFPALQKQFGAIRCTHPPGFHEPLRGKDGDGRFKTRSTESELYTPLTCERLGRALWAATLSVATNRHVPGKVAGGVGDRPQPATPTQLRKAVTKSTIVIPREGDRVEVYWTKEKSWYAGTVTSMHEASVRIKNKSVKSPHVVIYYDDGVTVTHSMHNNEIRLEEGVPSISLLMLGSPLDMCTECNEEGQVATDQLNVIQYEFDIETGELLTSSAIYTIDGDAVSAAFSSNTTQARHWHEPANEREYNRSPQRDLWRTAKELKWDQYLELKMFTWVPQSAVDLSKHKIYNTLWAYKIKLNSDLTFNKLNPRWCLKGGTMDRDIYKSHAETLRSVSFRVIAAIKSGYWEAFVTFLLDCSNAFQATRTDVASANGEPQPDLYCWPGPGFEKRSEKGERMVCKVHVGMQGRIDATRLFNTRLFEILVSCGMFRSLWDKQVAFYHRSSLAKSDASLSDILLGIKDAKDTEAQQPPIGFAMIGWHVDDGFGIACAVGWPTDTANNRVIQYIRGAVATHYATTLTGWHGHKALGFTLTLDEKERTVKLSALDAIQQLAKDLLKDCVMISPKHIWSKEFFDIPAGEVPVAGDPSRATVLAMMAQCRHGLGVMIWVSNVYPQSVAPTNLLCKNMAFPHDRTLKCLRHMVMHLLAFPDSTKFGGHGRFGLGRDDTHANPLYPWKSPRSVSLHWFSDANLLLSHSVTGGVGMLSNGCIQAVSLNQHLASPGSHTSETVGAGTNDGLAKLPAGLLQEAHIQCGDGVPFYLDSASTVFVAKDDAGVKKSVWLIRRAAVLQESVEFKEIEPIHISEQYMVADAFTKYLPYEVWRRHMNYLLNL